MGWFFITQSTWHAYGINVIKSSSFTELDSTFAMTFKIFTFEWNICSALVKLSFSSRLSKSFPMKFSECLHLVRLKFKVSTVDLIHAYRVSHVFGIVWSKSSFETVFFLFWNFRGFLSLYSTASRCTRLRVLETQVKVIKL